MKSYSVRLALGMGFFIVTSLFIFASGFMAYSFEKVHFLEAYSKQLEQTKHQGNILLSSIQKLYIYQTHILFLGDTSYIQNYQITWNAIEKEVLQLKSNQIIFEMLTDIHQIEQTVGEMHQYFLQIFASKEVSAHYSIRHHHYLEIVKWLTRVRIQIFNLNSVLENRIENTKAKYHQVLTKTKHTTFFMCSLALFSAIIVGIVVFKMLNRPIQQLYQACTALETGHWETRVPQNGPYELKQLAKRFNEMSSTLVSMKEQIRIKERLAVTGELAAGIAHEINNPLGVIIGYIRLIRSNPLTTQIVQDLNVIEEEVLICQSVVQGLLDLTRFQSYPKQNILFAPLIYETVTRIQQTRLESDVTISFEENFSGDGMIFAEEYSLRRLFHNLFVNAFDAIERSGEIKVSINEEKLHWIVQVKDSGFGITPEIKENLFKPFKTTKEHGTGLGLVICQSIVKEHSGTIEFVTKNVERGTCVQIMLPKKPLKTARSTE